jgi:hypothetical protein
VEIANGAVVEYVAVYNRVDLAGMWPAALGTFEIWLGSEMGDVSSFAILCGSASYRDPVGIDSEPYVVSCGGSQAGQFVTIRQVGPPRYLVIAEVEIYGSDNGGVVPEVRRRAPIMAAKDGLVVQDPVQRAPVVPPEASATSTASPQGSKERATDSAGSASQSSRMGTSVLITVFVVATLTLLAAALLVMAKMSAAKRELKRETTLARCGGIRVALRKAPVPGV